MADLNPNLRINLHDIFRDKFGDFREIQRYEITKVDTTKEPPLIFLRNLSTNVVQKRSPEQVNLFFIKETIF